MHLSLHSGCCALEYATSLEEAKHYNNTSTTGCLPKYARLLAQSRHSEKIICFCGNPEGGRD